MQRLNRLADCFPTLVERFCATGEAAAFAGLVDSMPVILTRQGRRFKAKVAPELASSGYCPTKHLYYHGVKIHLVGDFQPGTLPSPRFIGLAPAGLNDGPALEQVVPALPYRELYADKAYEYLKRAHGLPFTVMAPVKKQKGQAHLDAAERSLIRSEFRARGGHTDPLDDGIWLHRWAGGPHKGQPKLDRTAIRTLLERGLVEIVDPPGRLPFARFSRAGLEGLRRLARDRRSLPPDQYAHLLAELDAKRGPE